MEIFMRSKPMMTLENHLFTENASCDFRSFSFVRGAFMKKLFVVVTAALIFTGLIDPLGFSISEAQQNFATGGEENQPSAAFVVTKIIATETTEFAATPIVACVRR